MGDEGQSTHGLICSRAYHVKRGFITILPLLVAQPPQHRLDFPTHLPLLEMETTRNGDIRHYALDIESGERFNGCAKSYYTGFIAGMFGCISSDSGLRDFAYERRAFEADSKPQISTGTTIVIPEDPSALEFDCSYAICELPLGDPPKIILHRTEETRQDVASVFYDAQLDHANALPRSSTNYAGHCRPPCPPPPRRSKPERRVWMTAILIPVLVPVAPTISPRHHDPAQLSSCTCLLRGH